MVEAGRQGVWQAYPVVQQNMSGLKREVHDLEGELRELRVMVTNNQRLIWFVFTSIVAFELNAIFGLIGH